MQERILTAQEVRSIVDYHGVGTSPTQKVKSIADRTETSRVTLYDYMAHGSKRGALNVLLRQLLEQLPHDTPRDLGQI